MLTPRVFKLIIAAVMGLVGFTLGVAVGFGDVVALMLGLGLLFAFWISAGR